MAVALRGLFRLNLGFANTVFSKYLPKLNFINANIRFMYMDRDLGIPTYENTRFVYRNQFVSIENTFRAKMREICDSEDGIIFTEDMKAMIHLAQPNETDMTLVHDMLQKFVKFRSEKQFGTYIFGSVIMRMCYYLNEPKIALSLYKTPEFAETFSYHSAVKTLMTLLYKHQMYDEVREVYELTKSRKGIEFSMSNNVLLFAACLKQNTLESAKYALYTWKEHSRVRLPALRQTAIVAYLAIKQNEAEEALEMISTSNRDASMSVRCLKVLAYTHLGKFLSIIPILKNSTEQETIIPNRHNYYAEVIYDLEEKLQGNNGVECEQLVELIEKLKKQQRIETSQTLEEFLLRPLQSAKVFQSARSSSQRLHENKLGLKNYV